MAGIYLSGRRNDLDRAPARAAAAVEGTADRWDQRGHRLLSASLHGVQ